MSAEEAGLLRAWADEPGSDVHWRILADWLEEDGQGERAELLRLHRSVLAAPWGKGTGSERLRGLLAAGVRPVLPRLANSLGMEFVLIPPGSFMMGALQSETNPDSRTYADERPRHRVTLTRAFWMQTTPVTQAQFQAVMRRNPSQFENGGDHPVENASWEEAEEFCRKLSGKRPEKRAGREYRLPTEAQWEHACRAGSSRAYHFTDEARWQDMCFEHPLGEGVPPHPSSHVPVGRYAPNAWGLRDMQGNVWEWCQDWYDNHLYRRTARTDPEGGGIGATGTKLFRGGSWCSWKELCRAACRSADRPEFRAHYLGFRAALEWRPGMALA
ncbi:MAG: SUMF1/EgtB/PvdO family nonheme iron enzyme [Gemmataceae bacterium]|nr:SUMF1/EgtB/PvdO family nonheme iron enzyme [Gemmataceae bacterium]